MLRSDHECPEYELDGPMHGPTNDPVLDTMIGLFAGFVLGIAGTCVFYNLTGKVELNDAYTHSVNASIADDTNIAEVAYNVSTISVVDTNTYRISVTYLPIDHSQGIFRDDLRGTISRTMSMVAVGDDIITAIVSVLEDTYPIKVKQIEISQFDN